MCFFMEDEEDPYDSKLDPNDPSNVTGDSRRNGSKRWHFHSHHSWIIPRKPLALVAALALFFIIVGIIFMAIGGGISSGVLKVIGGLMLGFGIVGLIVCTLVCLHAYFFYGIRDQSTQTVETSMSGELTPDLASYASAGRPSALKSPDSTLKRNGTLGVKKVTMAPELGPYGEIQPIQQPATSPMQNTAAPPLHRLPVSGTSSRSNSMPRSTYVDGNTVGTGGIKITPLDPNQPFPSPGSSISGGQYYSTGGGGSSVSGSMDTYAYPRSVLSYDSNGSQYSTLRSIPVTHLDSTGSNQKYGYKEESQYAMVNKSAITPGTTVVHVEHAPGQHSNAPANQGLLQHVQQGQNSTVVRVGQTKDDTYDMDYDNTIERSPMMPPQQQANSSNNSSSSMSYHQKQMQFQHKKRPPHHQQQHQQDLHAPRQINAYSLQRQYAANPMILQQQNDAQIQQYKMQHEQEKKLQQQQQQQQQQYQFQYNKSSNASSARNSIVDDVFDPQPLVHPSARRPMTFEQVSSSKMSVYDNMLANSLQEKDELET